MTTFNSDGGAPVVSTSTKEVGGNPQVAAPPSGLRNQVLSTVLWRRGMTTRQIAYRTGMHPRKANKFLRELVERGFVLNNGRTRHALTRWWPTPPEAA